MYESFDNREQASKAAAAIIASSLRRRLEAHDRATVVISGGGTPIRAIERLSGEPLPWARITVTLSDERWLPPEHEDSNERMIREHLLRGPGADAELLPLYAADQTPGSQAEILDGVLRLLPIPFACSLLGMGEDGHFASLFPDAGNLAEGVDVDGDRLAIPVETAASPYPRISLTLSALSRSDTIVLLIYGEKKLAVLERALSRVFDQIN